MRFEDGDAAIAALVASAPHPRDLNEATTRLQLIDRVMFECLGWDRGECVSEERLAGSITDYSFSAPYRCLILEAKREGTTFEVPVGSDRVHKRPITYFRKNAPDVFEAIDQCLRYCLERGTSFGLVSNGRQFVAFLASRLDGVSPLGGDALVFPSLAACQADFLTLWNCLSRDGIAARRLATELAAAAIQPPPPKLSASIVGYPGYKNRNSLQTELQILGELVIEDIARAKQTEEDFLRQCYSSSGALSQYALVSKAILEASYSALLEKAVAGPMLVPATTKKGIDPELLAQSLSRRPVLLVGDVGVGKTAFIRHLIKIDAREFLQNAVVLYIDLGTKPSLRRDLPQFVGEEIKRQLLDEHHIDIDDRSFVRGVYHGELSRFERSIHGDLKDQDPAAYRDEERKFLAAKLADLDGHIRDSLTHLSKGRGQQIVIVLDNVDQRPHEFQQEVFLIGTSIAAEWPSTVFLALRPESYYRSRTQGALTAYHPRAFTIAPPRLDIVVQKRLEFALRVMERGELDALPGVSIQVDSLHSYIEILLGSFERDRHLIDFCDNMAGGNVRLALDFVKTFVGSGHVDTQKILDIYAATQRYVVPLHEFLRAVIYRDNEHFNPGTSEIMNAFDLWTSDPREHFLVPILLAHIERTGDPGQSGYSRADDLQRHLQDLGFSVNQTRWALARCLSKKLVERPARSVEESDEHPAAIEQEYLRITSIGAYYVKRLVANFTYVDAMVVDTPITRVSYRAQVRNVYSVVDRLARAEVFRQYLDDVWPSFVATGVAFDWPECSSRLRTDIVSIQQRADGTGAGRLQRRPLS